MNIEFELRVEHSIRLIVCTLMSVEGIERSSIIGTEEN